MLAPAQSQILEAPPYRPHILPVPETFRLVTGRLQSAPSLHEAFLNQKFFANLDVLRGVAILAVVFHHSGPVGNPWLTVLQGNCRYGVSLFFALSGFLICSLLLREEQRNGQVSLTDFYIRRSLRLFPLYYGMLLIYCVLVFGLGMFSPENQIIFKERLPYNALYLSNFLPVTGPFFFAWSLAVEEQFYLVFGQLFRWARRSWLIGSIVLLVVAKPLMNLAGVLALDQIWVDIVFSYSEPLLLGVLGGFVLNHRRGFVVGMATASPRVLAGLTLALVLMLATIPLHNKSGLDTQVMYILMALIVMGCAIRPKIPLPGQSMLAHIGVVCYGIYLTHMLVIMVVQRLITDNPYLTFLLSAAGVTVLASVIYRYFESPILQYKKHFSHA
jgi:peptidoglycan/LPS O-acetylase OafA/YrhL